jgi:uncharacterized protein involved in exopolysaccharide biosynthesis
MRQYRRQWKVAVWIMVFCAVCATTYLLIATPLYRAQITVQYQAPAQHAGGLNLSANLGALVGLQSDKTPERAKALGTLKSRAFLLPVIHAMHLEPEMFPWRFDKVRGTWRTDRKPPTENQLHEEFLNHVMSIDDNTTTGLITLSFFLPHPDQAQLVANQLIDDVNENLRQDALSQAQENIAYLDKELATAQVAEMRVAIAQLIQAEMQRVLQANGRTTRVFAVIDPALLPDRPYAPRVVLVVTLAVLAGLVLGLVAALGRLIFAQGL